MPVVNAAAAGVDPTAGRYTVYVPPPQPGAASKYVVYDNQVEAQADVDTHQFGAVYQASGGSPVLVYQFSGMSTYTPPAGTPPVQLMPSAPPGPPPPVSPSAATVISTTPQPAPWGWVTGPTPTDPTTAATLGAPTTGSVALGAVTPTSFGADVVAYVGTTMANDTFTFTLGGQINGNWGPLYNLPDKLSLATQGWSTFTLHLNYDQIDAYLKTVNPALGITPNLATALGVTFGTGHNTGMPGWSGNSGTDKDASLVLPARV